MARKFWLYFGFFALFLLVGQTANAKDGLFGVGARFAWENYKVPVLVQTNPAFDTVDVSKLNKTNFGGDLQIKPIDRLAITLALDMTYSKYSVRPYIVGDEKEVAASCFSFGFLLGVKFYVIEPAPKKATLYLKLDGGKYLGKAKNDASSDPGNEGIAYQVAMLGDLSSPLVIQFAVGAEFFVAKSFSIGADILGFRMAYSKGDNGPMDAGLAASTGAGAWSGDQKLITMSFYSAFTLNFGFYKGTSSKMPEEDNEDAGGWGNSGGGAAGGNDGWGASGAAGGSANTNDGWGAAPAGGNPPSAGGNDGWATAPAPAPAPAEQNAGAGWGAAPADNGGGGWEAAPPPPDDENPTKANKPRPKPKAAGGGGNAAPPPPPPGY